jgi:hypothetical protein
MHKRPISESAAAKSKQIKIVSIRARKKRTAIPMKKSSLLK